MAKVFTKIVGGILRDLNQVFRIRVTSREISIPKGSWYSLYIEFRTRPSGRIFTCAQKARSNRNLRSFIAEFFNYSRQIVLFVALI